jgi:hypothetical protein
MDKETLNSSKLFEKIEIGWFSVDDMKRRKKEFRGFYQEIVDLFLEDKENIRKFIEKKCKKTSKTRKNRDQ